MPLTAARPNGRRDYLTVSRCGVAMNRLVRQQDHSAWWAVLPRPGRPTGGFRTKRTNCPGHRRARSTVRESDVSVGPDEHPRALGDAVGPKRVTVEIDQLSAGGGVRNGRPGPRYADNPSLPERPGPISRSPGRLRRRRAETARHRAGRPRQDVPGDQRPTASRARGCGRSVRRRGRRRADPLHLARPHRPRYRIAQGSRTTDPVVLRPSRSRCACSAWASG